MGFFFRKAPRTIMFMIFELFIFVASLAASIGSTSMSFLVGGLRMVEAS
jgi:hypothetical protein